MYQSPLHCHYIAITLPTSLLVCGHPLDIHYYSPIVCICKNDLRIFQFESEFTYYVDVWSDPMVPRVGYMRRPR